MSFVSLRRSMWDGGGEGIDNVKMRRKIPEERAAIDAKSLYCDARVVEGEVCTYRAT